MELSEALARTSISRLTEFASLSDVLEPDIIQSCLASNAGRDYEWSFNNHTHPSFQHRIKISHIHQCLALLSSDTHFALLSP